MFLQEIFQKLEQTILQQVRQDLFFVVGKRARERENAENVQGTQKLGNRRQAFNARFDRRKDGRTDGRTDGRMDDSTHVMTDGCVNAVTAVENQSFLRSFPFSPESLNGLLHRATLFTLSPKPARGYY